MFNNNQCRGSPGGRGRGRGSRGAGANSSRGRRRNRNRSPMNNNNGGRANGNNGNNNFKPRSPSYDHPNRFDDHRDQKGPRQNTIDNRRQSPNARYQRPYGSPSPPPPSRQTNTRDYRSPIRYRSRSPEFRRFDQYWDQSIDNRRWNRSPDRCSDWFLDRHPDRSPDRYSNRSPDRGSVDRFPNRGRSRSPSPFRRNQRPNYRTSPRGNRRASFRGNGLPRNSHGNQTPDTPNNRFDDRRRSPSPGYRGCDRSINNRSYELPRPSKRGYRGNRGNRGTAPNRGRGPPPKPRPPRQTSFERYLANRPQNRSSSPGESAYFVPHGPPLEGYVLTEQIYYGDVVQRADLDLEKEETFEIEKFDTNNNPRFMDEWEEEQTEYRRLRNKDEARRRRRNSATRDEFRRWTSDEPAPTIRKPTPEQAAEHKSWEDSCTERLDDFTEDFEETAVPTVYSKLPRHICKKDHVAHHLQNPCIFCDGTHRADECPNMTDAVERKAFIRKAGRCVRCFRRHRGHCDWQKGHECRYCYDSDPSVELHHPALCTEVYLVLTE